MEKQKKAGQAVRRREYWATLKRWWAVSLPFKNVSASRVVNSSWLMKWKLMIVKKSLWNQEGEIVCVIVNFLDYVKRHTLEAGPLLSNSPQVQEKTKPRALTGSPPEAKEMDCMWWFAIICKIQNKKQDVLLLPFLSWKTNCWQAIHINKVSPNGKIGTQWK